MLLSSFAVFSVTRVIGGLFRIIGNVVIYKIMWLLQKHISTSAQDLERFAMGFCCIPNLNMSMNICRIS